VKLSIAHFVRHVLAVILVVVCGDSLAAQEPLRPDVLVIMPDQMRGDCLSILGHPVVRTPHLDELAREGVLFRRAYTTASSCIPARRSLLTGLYPQTSGVVGYANRPISSPTMPQLLADAGYATVLVGRSMHQVPRKEPYGFQMRLLSSAYDKSADWNTYLKKVAPETEGYNKLLADLGLSRNGWEAKSWPLADEHHRVAWIVRQARKVLGESATEKPLFLTASFVAPHPPLFPPKKYFDYYYASNLPRPAHGDWVDWAKLSPKGDRVGHRVLLEGEPLRAAQAGYFGLIEQIDDEIAPLVEEFKARSSRAGHPWLIWVIADHGEMLGDHGYFRKCEPYEGSANIPFIVAGSAELGFRPGFRSLRPVCLEDVMPTLLQLAGATPPPVVDGVNLLPALRGEGGVIRPWLHFEHAKAYSYEQGYHALTDGRFKYIWRPANGTEQLFDLENDPREEHDLSKDTAHRQALETWRTTLTERLAGRPEGFSDGKRLIPGRAYPPLHPLP
jgi:arylsulfatase